VTILHIDSSITGDNSVSRTISSAIIERLKQENPGSEVVRRDLIDEPLPHLTLAAFADSSILEEFLAADTVVIGAPMYNFTVPSQLKAWIDRIVLAGKTFRYTENGPEGLAKGKRVIIALARGGLYGEGSPAAALEHVETYLRGVFNFIGIEPEFVVAEGVNISPEHKENAIAAALGETVRLAA
jgi:FMN-dependent NADH-azoreductase